MYDPTTALHLVTARPPIPAGLRAAAADLVGPAPVPVHFPCRMVHCRTAAGVPCVRPAAPGEPHAHRVVLARRAMRTHAAAVESVCRAVLGDRAAHRTAAELVGRLRRSAEGSGEPDRWRLPDLVEVRAAALEGVQ